jgi:hypothetical protein
VLAVSSVVAQENFKTYREAYRAGAKAVNAGRLDDARAPLEAAARLAATDREKLEAHRALMIPYRELREVEPMQKAAEYVITNSASAPERSLARGEMLSFVHKRGKMGAVVEGYEERLKKTPDDRTALYVLAEAYGKYKEDAGRAAKVGEQLAALEKKAGKAVNVPEQAKLAAQYVKSGRLKDGAELFESIAPADATLAAWHWKEAAAAWLKAGDKAKALAAAKNADAAGPEKRGQILTHFWYRAMGDVYLDAGEPKSAVPHYEKAIASTKNDGYVKDCQKKLAQAKAAADK